jgi:hypothetical protein
MSTLYKVLGTLVFAIFIIILGVGYVWYSIAFTPKSVAPASVQTETITPSVQTEVQSTTTQPAPVVTPVEKEVRINTSALTSGQQALLKKLGVDTTNLVITPAMKICATNAIGVARLSEIEKGTTPTLTEGLNLLVCYKK